MIEFQHCCLLLMALAGSSLATANVSKSGCSGDYMELYSNISLNSEGIVVSLYKNGEHNRMIAMWSKQNSVVKETFDGGYNEKVYLDKYGTILMRNLTISDEGKYAIKIILGTNSTTHEVQLIVLVAPPKYCKPKITHVDNTLTASLEIKDCGNPAASVSWLDHPGLSNKRGRRKLRNRQFEMTNHGKRSNAVMLRPGKEAGTYFACIKSPALRCASNSNPSDFCTAFTVEENNIRSSSSRSSEMTTVNSSIHSSLVGASAVTTDTSETQSKLMGFIDTTTGILVAIVSLFTLFLLAKTAKIIHSLYMKKKLFVKDEEAEKARSSTELEKLFMKDEEAEKARSSTELGEPLVGIKGAEYSTRSLLPGEDNSSSSPYISIGFTRLDLMDSSNKSKIQQLQEDTIDSYGPNEIKSEVKTTNSPYMNIDFIRPNSRDSSNKDESEILQEDKRESTDINEIESKGQYIGDSKYKFPDLIYVMVLLILFSSISSFCKRPK